MMLEFVLTKKDYKKLLIILNNCYTIDDNQEAKKLADDFARQGGDL